MTPAVAIPESAVLTAVMDYLLYRGGLIIRINSGAIQPQDGDSAGRYVPFNRWQCGGLSEQRAGVSDILAILPPPAGLDYASSKARHLFVAVECKAPGKLKNVTAAQRLFLDEVASRGGLALVVDDVGQLVAELEKRGY